MRMKKKAVLFLAILWPLCGVADEAKTPPPQAWSFQKMFGGFNKAALQRGFQVYKEVCATCHGLKLMSYRHLSGLGFSAAEIKAIAAAYQVQDGPNDEGAFFERPGTPQDSFVSPFANDKAARAANNGSLPPDLSLIIKARKQGPDYVYALLTSYNLPAPKDIVVEEGRYYNPYMSGGQIAMAPPLKDAQVTYSDGTKATVSQMAHDVVTFLAFTAEPELEDRKRTGTSVLIYLGILTALLYLTKKRIWKRLT